MSDRASARRTRRTGVEATRRLQITGLLVFLIAASTALRAWAAWPIPGPSTADDDFAYSELGRAVHEVGLIQVIGAPVQFNSIVYPRFVDVPISLGDRELGYTFLKILQALVMSAAVVPVYLWGRLLLGRPWALAVASITVAAPALAYSGLLVTEALFYPLVAVAAWASSRALVSWRLGSQALAVASVAVVTAVRFQAIVLAPAFLAAILLMAVFERDPRRPLRYWPSFLGVVGVGAAWTVWQLDNKSRISALVDDDLGYGLGEAFLYSRWHLAGLLLITGAVPLCALALLLVDALRGRELSAGARAYIAVSSAFACFVLAEVAFFASRHAGTLTERALVSLLPILVMAVPLWVIHGARRPRLQVGLVVGTAFVLVASLPLKELVADGAVANTIALSALDPLELDAVGVSLQLGALLTVALLLAFAFVPSRHAWTLVAVLFVYLAGISISSSRTLTTEAEGPSTAVVEPPSSGDAAAGISMGPLRTLRTNPRYFTRDGKRALYVTGSHTWWNLVDLGPSSPPPAFAYDDYLRKLQRWGHNFVRLWAREDVRDDVTGGYGLYNNAPHPVLRPGPGTALDGLPKFDLTRLNQAYFDRMRRRILAARRKGMYVSIMLFEGNVAQFAGEQWDWEGHPMNPANNVNGIDGDTNGDGRGIEVHTLRNPRVTRIQEAYVRKVVDTVGDLDNVLYEIGNEMGSYSTAFQYHFTDFIKGYERTKGFSHHPIGMTFQHEGGSNETLLGSSADWVSPKDSTHDPTVYPPTKVVISDSDHHCGATCVDGDWVWRSFTRGQNPIFMDAWGRFRQVTFDDVRQMHARRAMGQTRHYANRANLTRMHPRPDLCSTGFCLADEGHEYIVYQPASGETGMPFEVDLSGADGRTFTVEWLATFTGAQTRADPVAGGGVVTLTPPFGGSWAVAYLRSL